MLRKTCKHIGIVLLVLVWLLTGWPVIWNNPKFPPEVSDVKAVTSLTAYLSNTADNPGTLTTANKINTTSGTETSTPLTTKVGKTTQYCELDSQGTSTACSGVASIGAPTGNGFILDATTLEGQYFAVGNWTGGMKLKTSVASGITVTAYMRAYKRSSGGVYSAIATSNSNSIALTSSAQTLTFNAGSGTATQFATGDKLYIDFWVNITANTANSSTATIGLYENGSIENMVTPGYNQVLTTIGNGTQPSNVSIYPSGAITDLDVFTLATNIGTDTVTGATVTLSPAGAYNNIARVDITDNSNNSKCNNTSLTSNTVSLSGCGLSVTTATTTYKVRITPKTYANMPAYGSSYATTASVGTLVDTNADSGSNTTSATVTVDNSYPNSVTATSGSAATGAITLNWTTSNSSSFLTTNGSVVLRWTGSSAGSEVPANGTTNYAAGNTIGTSTVACVISSAASTALSKIDGSGGSSGCTTTALANGQAYSYKIFQASVNGNYDQGVTPTGSPFTIPAIVSVVISSNSSISYGHIAPGGNANTSSLGLNITPVAQNNGNVAEDFSIAGTNSVNWTLGSSPGSETYSHKFCTSSCTSPPTNYTSLTTSNQTLASNIAVSGTQGFDLAIYLPTSTSNFSQQSVNVVITATQH